MTRPLQVNTSAMEMSADDVLCVCYICLASPTDPVLTPCCHLFCRECVISALEINQTGLCPVCKTQVKGGLTPLHSGHIQQNRRARDLVPYTRQSVLKIVEKLHYKIALARAGLKIAMEGMCFRMHSIEVHLHKFQLDSLQGKPHTTESVEALKKSKKICRQEEARITRHLEARNNLVLEIMHLLRAVAASNHLLPLQNPDHVPEQAIMIPVRKELLCRVCNQPPASEPVATSCGHLFCWACLHTSFRGQDESPCPVCRTGLKVERNVTPVYAAGGSSCNAPSAAGNLDVVPPMPTWTPSAAIARGVRHDCVRSNPILTMLLVNEALRVLEWVAVNDEQERAFFAGGWKRVQVRGDSDITILMWNHDVLLVGDCRSARRQRQLRAMNLLGGIVLRLEILLAQPLQSVTRILS